MLRIIKAAKNFTLRDLDEGIPWGTLFRQVDICSNYRDRYVLH
jgi:hypothetical protein